MPMSKKVLVLFAHPSQERSEVNVPLFQAAQQRGDITCIDLYAEYPTHDIDVKVEQQRLKEHDVIIFLFPLYWYSTPAILKDWMDLVLEYNFAYGKKGTVLKGKILLPALSAGGAEAAYQEDGYNHFSIRELLRPLEQTANLCKMQFLSPFAIFGSRTAAEEGRIEPHLAYWKSLLQLLIDDRIDVDKANKLEHLSTDFGSIQK